MASPCSAENSPEIFFRGGLKAVFSGGLFYADQHQIAASAAICILFCIANGGEAWYNIRKCTISSDHPTTNAKEKHYENIFRLAVSCF